MLHLRADRKDFRGRRSHEDGHRRLARQRTAAAQLTTALVSGWMAGSCVYQDVEVALLVIFAARRRAENPRVPHARSFSSEIDGFTFGWSLYPVGEFLTVAFMILRGRLLKTPARTSERRARAASPLSPAGLYPVRDVVLHADGPELGRCRHDSAFRNGDITGLNDAGRASLSPATTIL